MTKLALYAAFGATLGAIGFGLSTWQFWCLMTLFFTHGVWSSMTGFDLGMKTMSTYVSEHLDEVSEAIRARKP